MGLTFLLGIGREKKKIQECNWKCCSSSPLLPRLPCHGRVSPGWRRHPCGKTRRGQTWWHCRWLRWHRGCPPARDIPGVWGEAVQSWSPAEPRTRGSRGVTCPARSVPRLFGVPRLGGGEAFPGCAGAEGSSEPWEGSPQHPGDVRGRIGT